MNFDRSDLLREFYRSFCEMSSKKSSSPAIAGNVSPRPSAGLMGRFKNISDALPASLHRGRMRREIYRDLLSSLLDLRGRKKETHILRLRAFHQSMKGLVKETKR